MKEKSEALCLPLFAFSVVLLQLLFSFRDEVLSWFWLSPLSFMKEGMGILSVTAPAAFASLYCLLRNSLYAYRA